MFCVERAVNSLFNRLGHWLPGMAHEEGQLERESWGWNKWCRCRAAQGQCECGTVPFIVLTNRHIVIRVYLTKGMISVEPVLYVSAYCIYWYWSVNCTVSDVK